MANDLSQSRLITLLAGLLVFDAVYGLTVATFLSTQTAPSGASAIALLATAVPGIGVMASREPDRRRKWLIVLCIGLLTSILIDHAGFA